MDGYARLSEAWLRFADQWRGSERVLFTGGLFASSFIPFWAISLFLFHCYKHRLFPQWRIQKDVFTDPELHMKSLRHVLFTQLVVQPAAAFLIYPYFMACGVQIHAPLPHPLKILLDFAVAIIVNDTIFYWTHRLLHHKSIYKYVHKKHHEFKVNNGISAEYAHPIEDVLANVLPTFGGMLLMKAHFVTICLWLILRVGETVDAHSGYEFPFSPFVISNRYFGGGGPSRHEFHHSHNKGCFGSFFAFWDWIMGTDLDYRQWKAEQEKQAKLDKSD